MRIEPPPSVACAKGTMPAATAAAAPPLEPPVDRSGLQGLRVAPCWRVSVETLRPNSEVAVFPATTRPAARQRATMGSSKGAR